MFGLRSFAPDHIGIGRVTQRARDRLLNPGAHPEEPFRRAFTSEKRMIALIHIARQERGGVGVSAGDEHGRHVQNIGRQPGRGEIGYRGPGRDKHFPAHVAALFLARELVLEMNAGRARLDHRLDQLENVERTAETRFGVGHDRNEPVDLVIAFAVRDLIGALQGLIDAPNDCGDAVRRVEALVGIHLAGKVGVRRDLPAAQVDRLQPGAHLLHRLVAGERAERRHERLALQQLPQFFRAASRQGLLRHQTALEPLHIA